MAKNEAISRYVVSCCSCYCELASSCLLAMTLWGNLQSPICNHQSICNHPLIRRLMRSRRHKGVPAFHFIGKEGSDEGELFSRYDHFGYHFFVLGIGYADRVGAKLFFGKVRDDLLSFFFQVMAFGTAYLVQGLSLVAELAVLVSYRLRHLFGKLVRHFMVFLLGKALEPDACGNGKDDDTFHILSFNTRLLLCVGSAL